MATICETFKYKGLKMNLIYMLCFPLLCQLVVTKAQSVMFSLADEENNRFIFEDEVNIEIICRVNGFSNSLPSFEILYKNDIIYDGEAVLSDFKSSYSVSSGIISRTLTIKMASMLHNAGEYFCIVSNDSLSISDNFHFNVLLSHPQCWVDKTGTLTRGDSLQLECFYKNPSRQLQSSWEPLTSSEITINDIKRKRTARVDSLSLRNDGMQYTCTVSHVTSNFIPTTSCDIGPITVISPTTPSSSTMTSGSTATNAVTISTDTTTTDAPATPSTPGTITATVTQATSARIITSESTSGITSITSMLSTKIKIPTSTSTNVSNSVHTVNIATTIIVPSTIATVTLVPLVKTTRQPTQVDTSEKAVTYTTLSTAMVKTSSTSRLQNHSTRIPIDNVSPNGPVVGVTTEEYDDVTTKLLMTSKLHEMVQTDIPSSRGNLDQTIIYYVVLPFVVVVLILLILSLCCIYSGRKSNPEESTDTNSNFNQLSSPSSQPCGPYEIVTGPDVMVSKKTWSTSDEGEQTIKHVYNDPANTWVESTHL